MKEMCRVIPSGSCPSCGHKQFVVMESTINVFLTNRDGEIIDSKEVENSAIGACCNCKKEYNMIPTSYGFIPATPLRRFLYTLSPHYNPELAEVLLLPNPMEVTENEC